MQLRSTIPFLTILFQLLFVPCVAHSIIYQENPLTKAIQLFDKEKYAEAEPLFKAILDDRPDDFMVNYFYGACRTENGHYSEKDLNYLLKASNEVNPLNIDYYFAVQNHAKSQWEKALAYYNMYKAVASVNEQEKVKLTIKMEQCTNHINPFTYSENAEKQEGSDAMVIVAPEVVSKNVGQTNGNRSILQNEVKDSANAVVEESAKTEVDEQEMIIKSDSTIQLSVSQQDTLSVQQSENESQTLTTKTLLPEEQIKFNVNSEIAYISVSNFKTEDGKNYFEEGRSKETELEKVLIRTEILREKYKTLQTRTERDSIGKYILDLEGQSYELKNVINQLFMQAKNIENEYWQNASPEETESFVKEINASLEANNTNNSEANPVSQELIITPIFIETEEVNKETQNTKASGIIYKIQLGAFSRGIPNNQKQVFSKISVIRKVENYTDENGVVVYTTGNLTSYEDAVEMQNQIRQEGIKDPKIAAYLNGKRITLEQAKEIETKK